jgi:hypothetical protein
MVEQGIDSYGAEYKRTDNDFHFKWLEQDNCMCNICHGTGAKIEFRYITRDYASNRQSKRICKTLQAHENSFWICPKCLDNLNTKKSVIHAPTIEPEQKWKRLMMHLADLQLTYSPNWGANGCGDQKLYEFVTGLIDELQGWEEGE